VRSRMLSSKAPGADPRWGWGRVGRSREDRASETRIRASGSGRALLGRYLGPGLAGGHGVDKRSRLVPAVPRE